MVGQEDVPEVHRADRMLPAPGAVFAGHLVEAVIGRGGMGVVYRARHRGLGRVVALKVIVPELLDDASTQRRFLQEATTAASIEHPNVVPIHDAGESDGIAYMVMRYVHGDDLGTSVRRAGPLAPARAAGIVAALGAALDAMHAEGYVHRDVKPRNVLVANDGHVYLTDFGLASSLGGGSGVTRPGTWVGTADYAAPEQIRGARAGPAADVYALGCLLYFTLTGRPPYERDSLAAKLWAHMFEPPERPSRMQPGVPDAFDDVVARALAKEPGARFPTAGALGRAAARAVSGWAEPPRSGPAVATRAPRSAAQPGIGEAPTVSSAAAGGVVTLR